MTGVRVRLLIGEGEDRISGRSSCWGADVELELELELVETGGAEVFGRSRS